MSGRYLDTLRFRKQQLRESQLVFGVDNDAAHHVATLPVGAPEIFQHEGQWFMAALPPSFKGIQITRPEWADAR